MEEHQQLEQPQHFAHGDTYNDSTVSSSELSSAAASDLLVGENDGNRNGSHSHSHSHTQLAGDFSDHGNVADNHNTAASVSSSSVAASDLLDTMEEQSKQLQDQLKQAQQDHHDENETLSASSAAASELLNKMEEQQQQEEIEMQTDEENSPIKSEEQHLIDQAQDHHENETGEAAPESFNGNEAGKNGTLTNSSTPANDGGGVAGITSTPVNVNFIPYEQHSTSRIGNDKKHIILWILLDRCSELFRQMA